MPHVAGEGIYYPYTIRLNNQQITVQISAAAEQVSASTEEMSIQVEGVTASAQSLAEVVPGLKNLAAKTGI